jgi:Raf kinase inhibitor-like YbhB/YbcL family protein
VGARARARGVLAGLALSCGAAVGCGGGGGENASGPLPEAPERITVTSTAFPDGATIPERFTCDGDGDAPALAWSGVPAGTRELALVVDDPDAGFYVHWTVAGIPPTATGLRDGEEPEGAEELPTSAGDDGWTPPCPPEGDGVHEYLVALYALDAPLGVGDDATPDEVRNALGEHAIARGVLRGRFGRG